MRDNYRDVSLLNSFLINGNEKIFNNLLLNRNLVYKVPTSSEIVIYIKL